MIVSIPDFIAWAVGCWLPAVALVDATSAIILSHETLNKEKLQLFDFKGSARNSYSRSNVRSSLLNAGMSFQTKNLRYLRLTNDTVCSVWESENSKSAMRCSIDTFCIWR